MPDTGLVVRADTGLVVREREKPTCFLTFWNLVEDHYTMNNTTNYVTNSVLECVID